MRRVMKHICVTWLAILAVAAGAAPGLDAPTGFEVTVTDSEVIFSWEEVEGAAHYCVDVRARVTLACHLEELCVKLCYGTKDTGDPAATSLAVGLEELQADLAAALGVAPGAVWAVDGIARVKPLGLAHGPGPNSGPFSEADVFVVVF